MSQLAQRLFMASGGKKDSTYVDDVFSNYLYKGNGSTTGDSKAINNGIKLGNSNFGNSVYFGGSGDYLSIPYSSDYQWNNQPWTLEYWVNANAFGASSNSNSNMVGYSAPGGGEYWSFGAKTNRTVEWYYWSNSQQRLTTTTTISTGQWNHLAFTYDGTTMTIWINGVSSATGAVQGTVSTLVSSGFSLGIGRVTNADFNGYISNVRITKGQALYTSNFTPSTEPFTTTSQGATASNVKLLCCNKDTVTGSDVTPGTITAIGVPTPSTLGTGTASDAKGGMVWIKSRDNAYWHSMVDTERGANKTVYPNSSWQEETLTNLLNSFNNNGFTPAYNSSYSQVFANKNNDNYASWAFAKQEGFFDIQTWTGNNTAGRQIPHNLGSRPGMVAIKCTSDAHNWTVWHRGLSSNAKGLILNDASAEYTTDDFNGAAPTSEVIYLSATNNSNGAGKTYVAYLWAGGASDEPGSAKSVDFDGSGDTLQIAQHADLGFGTGDYTVEFWIKFRNLTTQVAQVDFTGATTDDMWQIYNTTDGKIHLYRKVGGSGSTILSSESLGSANGGGQWFHIAVTRASNTTRLYVNGTSVATTTDTTNYPAATFTIANRKGLDLTDCNCQVSNVRIVKGTAVYTSSFRPPTQGLTAITNTKLLCCNKNTVTGSTVTPGTITSGGNPQSSTNTPFDDPNGFKFGEGGDQNIIKCGSYIGASGANKVNLGWEPQWVMVKNRDSVEPWVMVDSMRRWTNESSGVLSLKANSDSNESTYNYWGPTATGWQLDLNNREIDQNEQNYIYIAIRRPDAYVGKPSALGTDVFAMDTGNSSSTVPCFDSGFPVGFALARRPASSDDWYAYSRLTGFRYLKPNTYDSDANDTNALMDSNSGWGVSSSSTLQSWMWKRGQGFDVVTYKGTGSSQNLSHGLGKSVEMGWIKCRSNGTTNWSVWHKDIPDKYILVNTTGIAQSAGATRSVSSTHYEAFNWNDEGVSGRTYIAMLFASVDGISKVGSYVGQGSDLTVEFGFSPRFLMVKRTDTAGDWNVFDTTRGLVSGADKELRLNNTSAQSDHEVGDITSTGFTFACGGSHDTCSAGGTWIYYAHA